MGLLKGFVGLWSPTPASLAPHPSARPKTGYSHSLDEVSSEPEFISIHLKGPAGPFDLTPAGCGNEPEFNCFAYKDNGCGFYYYAHKETASDGRYRILVHHKSCERFSGPHHGFTPKDHKRILINLHWMWTQRRFDNPLIRLKLRERPTQIDLCW
jgi:hypothetical protein